MKKNYIKSIILAAVVLFGINNTLQAQLYINEFMASNDAAYPGPQGDFPDWIEIYNAGNTDVNLAGYYMSDVLDDPEALYQISSAYPDSVTVPAGGFIIFYANKDEETSVLNLNFKLSGSGESIGLWDAEETVIDQITYTEQTSDISYGRYPDGTDDWGFMIEYTPGTANSNPAPAVEELYINEFMASNDAAYAGPQGDFPDWIEIYNPGTEDINLAGYYMYDTLDFTQAFQIPATYPDSVTVPAGGFIVFYANKGEETSVLNLNFKLSGSGEQIGLWNSEGELIDGITYGDQITDTSYGRYADGTENWYLMSDFTPGMANTNPNPTPSDVELYINEFMASNDNALPGPQGDYPDWIEIYNAGDEDIMLGGYYMSDVLDDPEALYMIPDTYPDSVTVAAGGYLVFYANKDEAYSVLNLNFKLSGSGEAVGLWDSEMAIVDSITYGEQIADTSYGRYTDGTASWFMMPEYTPGASNINSLSIGEIEKSTTLTQNFPNPFSNETSISFKLDNGDNIQILVYDIKGSLVNTITNGYYPTGNHVVKWNAESMESGYYIYKLVSSSEVITKKALLVK